MLFDRRDLRIAHADLSCEAANRFPVSQLIAPLEAAEQFLRESDGGTDEPVQIFPAAERLQAVASPVGLFDRNQRGGREQDASAIPKINIGLMSKTLDCPGCHFRFRQKRNAARQNAGVSKEFSADDAPALKPGVW